MSTRKADTAPATTKQQSRIFFWISAPEALHILKAIDARPHGGDVCVVVSPSKEQRVEGLGLPFAEDLERVRTTIQQQVNDPVFAPQLEKWLTAQHEKQSTGIKQIGAALGQIGNVAALLTPLLEHPAAQDSIGEMWGGLKQRAAVSRNLDDACAALRESARQSLDEAASKAFLALVDADKIEAQDQDVTAAWRVVAFALHALLRGNADERKTLRDVHRQITSGDIAKAFVVMSAEAAIEAYHMKPDEDLQRGTTAALKAALATRDECFGKLDEAKIRASLSNAVPAERGERRGRKGGAVRHGAARVAAELVIHVGAWGYEQRDGESRQATIVRVTRDFDQANRRMRKRLGRDAG